MKARPILFSSPMIRALLAGTKTQTRRVVKGLVDGARYSGLDRDGLHLFTKGPTYGKTACLYGRPGDLLWVRETLELAEAWQFRADGQEILMAASDSRVPQMIGWAHHVERDVCVSIHMPRWASRLTLEITDVRVERLQAISEADAKAEGLEWVSPTYGVGGIASTWHADPRQSYFALWNSINGPNADFANPWVWVVEFKVYRANVDAVLAQRSAK